MTSSSDQTPHDDGTPTGRDDRVSAAFRELKDDTKMVRPTPLDAADSRRFWLWPTLLAGAAVVALVVGIVAFSGGSTPVETPPATDTTVLVTTEPPATQFEGTATTSAAAGSDGILAVEDNGYFPWLFPSPTLSWYEEGCPELERVARDFMANVFDVNLEEDAFQRSPTSLTRINMNVVVPNLVDGSPQVVSILRMARVDPGVVDCEAWAVERAILEDPGIASPQHNQVVGNDFEVSGPSREGFLEFLLIDESYAQIGRVVAVDEVVPRWYGGQISFDREPVDANVMVIARTSAPSDSAIVPFVAVKVRYEGTGDILPPTDTTVAPGDAVGPVAVIGVAFDDVLNARTQAGVQNDILGEISPFEIGTSQYEGETFVGDARWVLIGNPQSRDFDAWVNASFLTLVEGEADQPAELYNAVTDVREALSLNRPAIRLGDVLAGSGGDSVVVSTDAFFNGDEQVVSSAQLSAAGGPGDPALLWGAQDGTGDPIEATIATFFDEIATSSALTSTERVAVNERIKFGNTIDNMAETFPLATIVELHYTGNPGEQQDFTWATVRLAFEPLGDSYHLVALALDNWTI